MKLTDSEIEFISTCTDGIRCAMDYHDSHMAPAEAMGFDISAHERRYAELKAEHDRLVNEWEGA